MRLRLGMSARRIVLIAGGLLGLLLLGGLGVAYSGLYSVAASTGHFPWTEWLLHMVMRRSVATHSLGVEAPPQQLHSSDFISLGAGHYQIGCSGCHGRPGDGLEPISAQMMPPPPTLASKIPTWSRAELFWIVRHGIKYTGMPAWSGDGRDDEVWAVVAFLERLPELDEAAYLELAHGNASARHAGDPMPASRGRPAEIVASLCVRCHDTAAETTTSDRVPRLGGQSRVYLTAALEQYRAGTRESGIMEPIAVALQDEDVPEVAALYAELRSPPRENRSVSGDILQRGRRIAEDGIADLGLPPCDACHGRDALALYPRLAGQSADYMSAQLELWRQGGRDETALGAIMAVIAERLDDAQIHAVTSHYARLDAYAGERP